MCAAEQQVRSFLLSCDALGSQRIEISGPRVPCSNFHRLGDLSGQCLRHGADATVLWARAEFHTRLFITRK